MLPSPKERDSPVTSWHLASMGIILISQKHSGQLLMKTHSVSVHLPWLKCTGPLPFPMLRFPMVFRYPQIMVNKRHPTPVLLPGKSHGWRSLVCCSPWGREESDKSEQLYFHFSSIGEGNGNPLQCSCCLENPRDGGAWWAAFYGVTQSRTRLK